MFTASALGSGLVEAILDDDLAAREANPPLRGISGRAHLVETLEDPGFLRVGRFGWKAEHATVLSHTAESALTKRYLAPPPQSPRGGMTGEAVFEQMGCASCHAPSFTTASLRQMPGLEPALAGKEIRPYSDFLLHDMGDAAAVIGGPFCIAAGGSYQGDDTDCPTANCPQPGACCFGDGSCTFVVESTCTDGGGTFQGEGVTCDAANCP